MKHLLAFAQLVRLPNTFSALADICFGGIATGLALTHWPTFVCLLGSSMLLYWSGMVWNDYFDVLEDRRDRPGRPLPSGRVSMRSALLFAIALTIGGILLALLADVRFDEEGVGLRWRSVPIAGVLVVVIFLYNGVFKATFVGPVFMGLCRLLNILLGLSILGTWPPGWGWLVAIVIGTYIAGITWFARTEAEMSSQTMLIGAAVCILVSLLLALSVAAVATEAAGDYEPSPLFVYALAAFGAYLGVAVYKAIRRPEPRFVQRVIKRGILGLVVLDAILVSAFVGSFGLLLAILLIPGMILGRWIYST